MKRVEMPLMHPPHSFFLLLSAIASSQEGLVSLTTVGIPQYRCLTGDPSAPTHIMAQSGSKMTLLPKLDDIRPV
jgi:hypothetical protein